MAHFRDTEEGLAFIESGHTRETSPEIMQAIAFFARDLNEAESLWNGDGFGAICTTTDMWEHVTGNGLRDGDGLFWGGRDWLIALNGCVERA